MAQYWSKMALAMAPAITDILARPKCFMVFMLYVLGDIYINIFLLLFDMIIG